MNSSQYFFQASLGSLCRIADLPYIYGHFQVCQSHLPPLWENMGYVLLSSKRRYSRVDRSQAGIPPSARGFSAASRPHFFLHGKWCEKHRGTWGFHHEKENISPKKGLVRGAPETRNKQDGGVIMSNNMGMTVYSHIDICNMYV